MMGKTHRIIRFLKTKSNLNDDGLGEDMFGKNHILINENLDYTLCGQATDEYDTKEVSQNPTCQGCIRFVKQCKKIKVNPKTKKGDE